jgi:hypothetical protein
MLSLQLSEFMVELKEGAIKNVGPPNKEATVKLYDVEAASAREFGDKRAKLAFEDGEGNEVEVALFPEDLRALAEEIETLESESPIFE